jgi:hypothetical protein
VYDTSTRPTSSKSRPSTANGTQGKAVVKPSRNASLLPGEYSQRQAEFLNVKQNSDIGLGYARTTRCIVQAIHSTYLDNSITLRVVEPKDEKIIITERTVYMQVFMHAYLYLQI